MLYLLDASVLITAKDSYYPLDAVPEFWEWLLHHAQAGQVKLPVEIFEEIKDGPKEAERDLLYAWIQRPDVLAALVLREAVRLDLVQRVVVTAYAPDLNDAEVDQIGRDPFLIAYGLVDPAGRTIVTAEAPRPGKLRAKRKVPDACGDVGVAWCGPFDFYRRLGFRTQWKA